MKKILLIPIILASTTLYLSGAEQYIYKDIKDFKSLDAFSSTEKFEEYYGKYVSHCLDNTYAGTMGIPCYVGYDLWDRELNKYYKKLHSKLNSTEKKNLEESQKAWLKNRDTTIKFNSKMLDTQYTEDGTLYSLMRAGAADQDITPMIKARALYLKYWAEFYGKTIDINN